MVTGKIKLCITIIIIIITFEVLLIRSNFCSAYTGGVLFQEKLVKGLDFGAELPQQNFIEYHSPLPPRLPQLMSLI